MEIEALSHDPPGEPNINDDNEEECPISVLSAAAIPKPGVFVSKKTLVDPRRPHSFIKACQDPDGASAIYREFQALVNGGT